MAKNVDNVDYDEKDNYGFDDGNDDDDDEDNYGDDDNNDDCDGNDDERRRNSNCVDETASGSLIS